MADVVPYRPDEILMVLERHQVLYVVIGGLAAGLRGSPYVTRDLDVTPARTRENFTRLAAALKELDAKLRIGVGAKATNARRSRQGVISEALSATADVEIQPFRVRSCRDERPHHSATTIEEFTPPFARQYPSSLSARGPIPLRLIEERKEFCGGGTRRCGILTRHQ